MTVILLPDLREMLRSGPELLHVLSTRSTKHPRGGRESDFGDLGEQLDVIAQGLLTVIETRGQ